MGDVTLTYEDALKRQKNFWHLFDKKVLFFNNMLSVIK